MKTKVQIEAGQGIRMTPTKNGYHVEIFDLTADANPEATYCSGHYTTNPDGTIDLKCDGTECSGCSKKEEESGGVISQWCEC